VVMLAWPMTLDSNSMLPAARALFRYLARVWGRMKVDSLPRSGRTPRKRAGLVLCGLSD
jgi:hypothetical protein